MSLLLSGVGRRALGRRLACLVVFAVVLAGWVGVSSAGAVVGAGYGPIGSFDPGGIGLAGSGRVAVDDATGNVLLADPGTTDPGSNRVVVMAPDTAPGGTATVLSEFAAPGAAGIAVDQVSHAVYVNEGSQVERFVSDGAPVPTYTADLTFLSPLLAHYGGPVAVDPANGDLLVGDVDHVNRYSSAGLLLGSFDGSGSPGGKFTSVSDIAVGSSSVYVLNLTGDYVGGGGVSRIVQLSGQGVYEQTVAATDTPVAIAVDGDDRLVTVGRAVQAQGGAQLSVFENGVVEMVGQIPNDEHYIGGVAADGGATGRVYVSSSFSFIGGISGVSVMGRGPGVHMDVAVSLGADTAQLTGLVNPLGSATTAHFEYCSLRDPCATNNAVAWQQGPDIAVGAGSGDVAVSADLTGLLPHTGYRARLAAVDSQATPIVVQSVPVAFTTADAPPVVVTGPVSDLSSDSATVTGTINPLGVQSTYFFEYGETTAYGSRVPTSGAGVAGNGFSARTVSRHIEGLKPGTLYHYRLVGQNTAGTTAGADQTLTTTAAGTQARAYEMVSPVDKQGIAVDTDFTGTRASPDGDAVMYGTSKLPLPGAQSAVFIPRVLGQRSSVDWTSTTLDLPVDNLRGGDLLFFSTLAVSNDVRRALVLSRDKLTDGASQGGWNLYIRQPGAQPPTPEFTHVATDPLLAGLSGVNGPFRMVGVSDDLRTTAFTDETQMYEAVVGVGVRLVSKMPDETPASQAVPTPSNLNTDVHQISTDGSRIYFNVGSISNGAGALYLRENGSRTAPISVSHRPGAPSTPVGAMLLGASPDGRYVEFTTACGCVVAGLTTGAPDGPGIYRYDVVTDTLTFLAEDQFISSATVPRPAQNAVFFETNTNELYYAHGGAVTKIADLIDLAPIMRASEDGRYLVFLTGTRLSSYDNTGHAELYRYDTVTAELVCVSCRTDGGAASSSVQIAALPSGESSLARYKSRVVLDDGSVFFDTVDPLVGSDVNGTRDVYVYRGGRASLVSRGTLPTSSQFADASPDGSNVFFSTDDRLVGQDQDTTVDLYDARVGGGLAGQATKPGAVACAGSECREAGAGPVSSDALPSQEAGALPGKPVVVPKAKVLVVGSSVRGSVLRLIVQVSGRGRVRASGARVTTVVRAASKAGRYTLKVPLSRGTRVAVKARRKVKVSVKVALTPPFGAPVTAKFSRTLGK